MFAEFSSCILSDHFVVDVAVGIVVVEIWVEGLMVDGGKYIDIEFVENCEYFINFAPVKR